MTTAFVPVLEMMPSQVRIRTLKKLKSEYGGNYLGVHYNQKRFFLVVGTKQALVTCPLGIKQFPGWASISVALEWEVVNMIDALDKSMLQALSESSEELFGLKCTPDMVKRLKYYLLVAYRKPDSDRAPLLGARVLSSTPIEDKDGHLLVKDPSSIDLTEIVAPGCKVQILLSIRSLFSKAENCCKLTGWLRNCVS